LAGIGLKGAEKWSRDHHENLKFAYSIIIIIIIIIIITEHL